MGYWVVRKYISGSVIERSKVYVPSSRRPRTGRVKGHTSAEKRDSNARGAARTLARLLNCNFSHADFMLTVKYDDEHLPETWQEQERDAGNFVRRLTRALKGQGAETVKSIIICSELDGKTGELVRKHGHIIISGTGFAFSGGKWKIGRRLLDDIWGKGSVYCESLWDQQDYTPLAVYLIKQTADHRDNRKKYRPSRNMDKPIVTEEIVKTGQELRAPKGAVIKERIYTEFGATNYLRYVKPDETRQAKQRTPERRNR